MCCQKRLDRKYPYLHPIFPVVIQKIFFKAKRKLISNYLDEFKAYDQHGLLEGKYMVPGSTIALIATAVRIFFLFFLRFFPLFFSAFSPYFFRFFPLIFLRFFPLFFACSLHDYILS